MEKEKLLKKIDECIVAEEIAIPVYGKHLKTAIFWSGLDMDSVKKVQQQLNVLMAESKKHKIMLENLKNKILTEGKDVY